MQDLESFAAIANVLDRPRRVAFDSLTGLTITGISPREAKLALIVLEGIDHASLLALAQGKKVGPVESTAPEGPPVQPNGEPNRARWQPKAEAPEPRSPRDLRVPQGPTTGVNAVFGAVPDLPEPESAPEAPEKAAHAATERPEEPEGTMAPAETAAVQEPASEPEAEAPADPAPDTGAECALDLADDGEPEPETIGHGTNPPLEAAPEEPDPPKPAPAEVVDTPKPDPKPKGRRKKAPPRANDLPVVLPAVGDKHEGVEIVKVTDHGDGGRLLIREDGWRIKINAKGKEVTRVEGLPDVSDVKTAADLQSESAAGNGEAKELSPPDEVLRTRMTRDVLQWLIEQGVSEKDAIVKACVGLKDKGALAFEASKNEEAVRRRVTSTLTVMGLN